MRPAARIVRVVEQRGQPDASVARLRVARVVEIDRIQIRRRIVRREQDQRAEERQDRVPIRAVQIHEVVPRLGRFSAVTANDVLQAHGASVVPGRRRASHAPQRRRQELPADVAAELHLVEVGAQVVPFEVGEDVLHEEGAAQRPLQRGMGRPVGYLLQEEAGGREERVERVAPSRIVNGLDVGDPPIPIDHHVGDVTAGAPDLGHQVAARACRGGFRRFPP